MKQALFKTIGIAAFMAVITTGCKKYDDGPAISLIPKEDRVANTWVVEKAMENGNNVTSSYDNYELYLTRDGDAQLTAKYTIFGTTYVTETNGTWEFTNNKDNIKFDYEDNSQDAEYQILRLVEKEFWLRQVGQDLELHLKEK